MSSPTRIELLQQALNIEQERASLQGKLEQILAQLAHTGAPVSGDGVSAARSVIKASPAPGKAAPAAKRGRAQKGELKERIFQALAGAGKAGMRVRDLALALNAKPEALHSWFQFARKTIPAIRKAGKGTYSLVGSVAKAGPAAPTPKAAVKAAPKTKRKGAGNQRGELAARIQASLKAAGPDGVRVGDLAKQYGMDSRNLFVWFSTTGKNFKEITKVGPGHYRLTDTAA
jgi:transposase-like protein